MLSAATTTPTSHPNIRHFLININITLSLSAFLVPQFAILSDYGLARTTVWIQTTNFIIS